MMTPGSSTLFVPGDKSYAGQGAGRADRTRRPYLKDLALQRRRGQAAGCVECSDILASVHKSLRLCDLCKELGFDCSDAHTVCEGWFGKLRPTLVWCSCAR
jgi:hypothetical protein